MFNYSVGNMYAFNGDCLQGSVIFQPGQTLLAPDQYIHILHQELEKQRFEYQKISAKLAETIREKEALQAENYRLKQDVRRNPNRVKRKYKKRISSLDSKRFECSEAQCGKRYSSRIALNAHKRKSHRRQPKI